MKYLGRGSGAMYVIARTPTIPSWSWSRTGNLQDFLLLSAKIPRAYVKGDLKDFD